jgi:hypothetical protein
MVRVYTFFVFCLLTLGITACSEHKENPKNQQMLSTEKPFHGISASSQIKMNGFIEVIKQKTLPTYPNKPIGTAFEDYSYFTKREWMETDSANGKFYIDFTGWFDPKKLDAASTKSGITMRGVGFKFLITKDGAFGLVMVSKLETKTDGKSYSYPLEDIKGILGKVFANKEIQF